MISVERCREILGKKADGVKQDDELIKKLLLELYSLSEVIDDMYEMTIDENRKESVK